MNYKTSRQKTPEVQYRKRIFKNILTNESLEHWFSSEIREIEGKSFWVTYNPRGSIALLAKDSWTLTQNRK